MTDLVFQEPGALETRQERALRRVDQLHNQFQSVFETLAAIYRDEDWRYVNNLAGRPYTHFTEFVQDQLDCAASNARRYQQGITGLILPLQDLTAPNVRIPVTSADVARLGVVGARVVVEEAPAALAGITDADEQTKILRNLFADVSKRSTEEAGPVRESTKEPASLGDLVPAALPSATPVDDDADDDDQPPPFEPTNTPSALTHQVGESAAQEEPAAPKPPPAAAKPDVTEPAGDDATPADPASPTDPALAALDLALAAVLATDEPAALAERVSRGQHTDLSAQCLAAAQRLARLGQLLRGLAADTQK